MSEQLGLDSGQEKAFTPTVPDGTTLDVAVSALIKELRAGHEHEAMYWAWQLESRFHKYLWRRLAIFACEDVGIANPQALLTIEALTVMYERHKRESKRPVPDPNLISYAILTLAGSPKNREADHLKNMVGGFIKEGRWRPAPPENAADVHTKAGKARNLSEQERTLEWFFVGSVCHNEVGPYDNRLAQWRLQASRGWLDWDFVDQWARHWDAAGELDFGFDGIPDMRYERPPTNVPPIDKENTDG